MADGPERQNQSSRGGLRNTEEDLGMKFTEEPGQGTDCSSNLSSPALQPHPPPCYCCPLVSVTFLALLGDSLSTVRSIGGGAATHPKAQPSQTRSSARSHWKGRGLCSLGFTEGPKSSDWCLNKGNLVTETQGRIPCNDRGRLK